MHESQAFRSATDCNSGSLLVRIHCRTCGLNRSFLTEEGGAPSKLIRIEVNGTFAVCLRSTRAPRAVLQDGM